MTCRSGWHGQTYWDARAVYTDVPRPCRPCSIDVTFQSPEDKISMPKSLPNPFTLFLAISSLCLSLISFALSIPITLPRPFHIPYSLLGLLFLLYPAHLVDKYFRAFRLRRRIAAARKSGLLLCLSCGYDLRESKDICPECGTRTVNQLHLLHDALQ